MGGNGREGEEEEERGREGGKEGRGCVMPFGDGRPYVAQTHTPTHTT